MNTPGNISQSRAEIIRQFFPTSPYVGHLGMQLTDMQPDMAILTLPFDNSLVTIGSTVHGGAIASLIDTAAMVAAWSDTAVPENMRFQSLKRANGYSEQNVRGTTVSLTVTYLAPAQAEDLRATARVLRRGRSLVYLDVEVQGASGTSVARGLVTYKLG